MATKGNVLVTGASGYVAGFTIHLLLDQGWSVRGTVRDPSKSAALHHRLGVSADQLPLFAADMTSDAGWADAVAGCSHVLHIASPIPLTMPRDDDEVIVPARDGTLRVLRAARDAGVRRVVMTSSAAAICYGANVPARAYTEADWSEPPLPGTTAYVRSKAIAERAARDFIAREGGALEFCTINPGGILGPVMDKDYAPSIEIIVRLLNGAMPGLPNYGFAIVDVRDLADLHIRAMTAPGMANERFLAAGDFLWMREVAAILKARLGARAGHVPARSLPDWLMRIVARFDKQVAALTPELGRRRDCDASHARDALGWIMRPAADTIADCANSLIEHGLIKA
jgi:dihydroflavonol-4-reductase